MREKLVQRQGLLAVVLFCFLGSGKAMAACSPPSVQVQDTAVYGTATAVVTFVSIPAFLRLTSSSVAGLTLENRDFGLIFGGGPISAIAAAAAYRTNVAPANGRFSGSYSQWQVASDQSGLSANQLRYEAIVDGDLGDILVGGSAVPSQSTTQSLLAPPLSELLTNNTICVGSAPIWDHQEWHQPGGDLWDWKQGDGHLNPSATVDPTKRLGTWAITGSGTATQVQHNYTASGGPLVYSFTVWKNPDGTYSFCDDANTEKAFGRIYVGEISCSAGGTQL